MNDKFYMLSWENGHVVIKNPTEVYTFTYPGPKSRKDTRGYLRATLVYGSNIKYDKSGNIYTFSDWKRMVELDPVWVAKTHFVGLL